MVVVFRLVIDHHPQGEEDQGRDCEITGTTFKKWSVAERKIKPKAFLFSLFSPEQAGYLRGKT